MYPSAYMNWVIAASLAMCKVDLRPGLAVCSKKTSVPTGPHRDWHNNATYSVISRSQHVCSLNTYCTKTDRVCAPAFYVFPSDTQRH